MTDNGDDLPLLDSLKGVQKDEKDLRILHVDGVLLHATQSRFVLSLIETDYLYIDHRTNSTASQVPSIRQLGERLLQNLDYLHFSYS